MLTNIIIRGGIEMREDYPNNNMPIVINNFRELFFKGFGNIPEFFNQLCKFYSNIHDLIFWKKVEAFFKGTHFTDEESEKIRQLLNQDNKKVENIKRIIQCIDNIETENVILYFSQATRAFLNEDILELETYFRVCYVLGHTLYEDLEFLQRHFNEKDITYNLNVQGLLASGLMHVATINGEEQTYSFTPLAEIVLNRAILYDEKKKVQSINTMASPQTEVEVKYATADDIDKLFYDE